MKKYVQHQAPILQVLNMKETLDYYQNILNFDFAWVWEDNYASVYNGDIELHFTKSDTVYPQTLYFFVVNADKVFDFLTKQKAEIINPIKSCPWGMREFAIKDLNGHIFRIGHGEKGVDEIASFSKSSG